MPSLMFLNRHELEFAELIIGWLLLSLPPAYFQMLSEWKATFKSIASALRLLLIKLGGYVHPFGIQLSGITAFAHRALLKVLVYSQRSKLFGLKRQTCLVSLLTTQQGLT